MGKVSKNGKPLGRPKGSTGSNGRQLGGYVVKQIESSFGILEKRGTSLAEIIANRLCASGHGVESCKGDRRRT